MGRKRKINKKGVKKLEKLIKKGYNNQELAEVFNVNKATIIRYINKEFPVLKNNRATYINKKTDIEKSGYKNVKIYAIYKKDELINIGTLDDIANQRNTKRQSVVFLKKPAYRNRTTEKALRLECIEDDIIRVKKVKEKIIKKVIKNNEYMKGHVLGYYDKEYGEYCICDNSEGKCFIEFYENKIEMLKSGYLLEIIN